MATSPSGLVSVGLWVEVGSLREILVQMTLTLRRAGSVTRFLLSAQPRKRAFKMTAVSPPPRQKIESRHRSRALSEMRQLPRRWFPCLVDAVTGVCDTQWTTRMGLSLAKPLLFGTKGLCQIVNPIKTIYHLEAACGSGPADGDGPRSVRHSFGLPSAGCEMQAVPST
jgi:hypothetical protein